MLKKVLSTVALVALAVVVGFGVGCGAMLLALKLVAVL